MSVPTNWNTRQLAAQASVEIQPALDVADLWDRFEVFEALHHNMVICNPMRSPHLDELVESLQLGAHQQVVDFACGSGELLLRCADAAAIEGRGVDLSPWMILRAAQRHVSDAPSARLTWTLGEARDFAMASQLDVACCIGGEWVWHDVKGTIRALAQRVGVGGRIAIGAPRLHFGADAEQVRRERGVVQTVTDVERQLVDAGLALTHRIDPTDEDWDAYLARTARSVELWSEAHPGSRSEQWLAEQRDWQAHRERDRAIIGWSVWVAEQSS